MFPSKKNLIFLFIACIAPLTSLLASAVVSQSFSQVKAYAGGYFLVKVKIERKGLDSFFTLEQELPKGMEATGVESGGSTFTFNNGVVKYSWLRLPMQDEINVVYRVKVPFEMIGKQELSGKYTFIDNEERQTLSIPAATIEIIEHLVASDTLAEKKLLSVANLDESKPTYISEHKEHLEFKIQILSSYKRLDKDSLRKEYALKDKITEEQIDGVYKYLVGSFNTYEMARDYKDKMGYSKYIPFVIAFNRGTRITIGEAINLAEKRKTIEAKK
jgi:hypothetical protein